LTLIQKQELLDSLRGKLPEAKNLLDNLEMTIRFSSSLENEEIKKTRLSDFIKKLKPSAGVQRLKLYTFPQLLSIWQLVAFSVKWLLVESEVGDPFTELHENFKTKLTLEFETECKKTLRGDLLQFVMELTEFLLLDLQPGCGSAFECDWRENKDAIRKPLKEFFPKKTGRSGIVLPEALKVEHAAEMWLMAAKMIHPEA